MTKCLTLISTPPAGAETRENWFYVVKKSNAKLTRVQSAEVWEQRSTVLAAVINQRPCDRDRDLLRLRSARLNDAAVAASMVTL